MTDLDVVLTFLVVVLIIIMVIMLLAIRFIYVKFTQIKEQFINEDGSVNLPKISMGDAMGFGLFLAAKEILPKTLPTVAEVLQKKLTEWGKK